MLKNRQDCRLSNRAIAEIHKVNVKCMKNFSYKFEYVKVNAKMVHFQLYSVHFLQFHGFFNCQRNICTVKTQLTVWIGTVDRNNAINIYILCVYYNYKCILNLSTYIHSKIILIYILNKIMCHFLFLQGLSFLSSNVVYFTEQ